ncbi:hypothetical protein BGX38DRAFT_1245118, partial [Terfezia claveryi]
ATQGTPVPGGPCKEEEAVPILRPDNSAHIPPAFTKLFRELAMEWKARGFIPANLESGAGMSACISAPNKPLATTGLPIPRTRFPEAQRECGKKYYLDDTNGILASRKHHAVTPASAPDEAQVIPAATKSEKIKLVTMHLRHILLGTLTKDVGELVLSSYEKRVERFCHDAATFLEKRLHHQGEGLQMLGDIKERQLEELSGLVMRRWVLMIRVLERDAKKGKEVKQPNVGAHTWG